MSISMAHPFSTAPEDQIFEEYKDLPASMQSAFATAIEANMSTYRATWRELETDVHSYYTRFKEAGCDAVMLVDDTYDREYSWYGLKGSPEQIAASFHESHNPGNSSAVLITLDLQKPLPEQWPYMAGELTLPHLKANPVTAPSLREAIITHDKEKFVKMTPEEKVASTARILFDFQLDRLKPVADAPQPPAV